MKIRPFSSSEIATGLRSLSSAPARLCGRSTGTPATSSGAVTMKMISSTSITSTSGVMLISDIGGWRPFRGTPPGLIMGIESGLQLARQGRVEAVGEAAQPRLVTIYAMADTIEGDRRRNRREQAD